MAVPLVPLGREEDQSRQPTSSCIHTSTTTTKTNSALLLDSDSDAAAAATN